MQLRLYRTSMLHFFRISIIILSVLIISSCNKEFEDIQFKDFTGLKISEVKKGQFRVEGNMSFYNPNNVRVKLAKAVVHVYKKDKHIATVVPKEKVIIKKEAGFDIPAQALVNLGDLDLLGSILSVLGGNDVKLRFKGYIVIKSWGIPIRVPVDFEESIRM